MSCCAPRRCSSPSSCRHCPSFCRGCLCTPHSRRSPLAAVVAGVKVLAAAARLDGVDAVLHARARAVAKVARGALHTTGRARGVPVRHRSSIRRWATALPCSAQAQAQLASRRPPPPQRCSPRSRREWGRGWPRSSGIPWGCTRAHNGEGASEASQHDGGSGKGAPPAPTPTTRNNRTRALTSWSSTCRWGRRTRPGRSRGRSRQRASAGRRWARCCRSRSRRR